MILVHLFGGPMDGQEYEIEGASGAMGLMVSAPAQAPGAALRILHGHYGDPGRDIDGRIVLQWLGWVYG